MDGQRGMIGRTLDHYRIESKLGEGGMGVVYKARDLALDRPVAIKILPPDRVAGPGRKQRFVQEAKAASALNHPNIVTIHDIRSDEGVDFIVMEYIEGQPLEKRALEEVLRWAIQMASPSHRLTRWPHDPLYAHGLLRGRFDAGGELQVKLGA